MAGRLPSRPAPRPKSWVKYELATCVTNRYTYPHATFRTPGSNCVWTHNGCQCNQVLALTHRHQVATPPMIETIDFADIKAMIPKETLQPYSRAEVIACYSGLWRTKYQRAYNDYKDYGLQNKHSYLSLFCKDDLEMGSPSKAPRAIQFRHPIFMLEQARFTKPVEKWFYNQRDEWNTRIVGKSDPFTIAREIKNKAQCFQDPVFLLLDASKFDSCVDVKWLKYCTEIYRCLFGKRWSRKINYLWSKTYVNRGFTRKGVQFKTWGTRMSGDMDTGLGNSIIMWTMLKGFLRHAGVKGSILVNGDDSVVVIERRNLNKCKDMSYFTRNGFNMKFEIAMDESEVEFCQARILDTDYGPTMARRPDRVMGRTSYRTKRVKASDTWAFINTLGKCERAASWGVPIASALATKMIQAANTTRVVALSPWLMEHYVNMQRWWKNGEPTISLQVRNDFESIWGISVAEQLKIEQSIKVQPLVSPTRRQIEEYNYFVHEA
nr:RNA-dependent RNA polymerase [Tolivirales sp.]